MLAKREAVSIFMVVSLPVTASTRVAMYSPARTTAAARASVQLDDYFAYLVPAGNGKINIWFTVYGNGALKEIGATQIEVF